jgi:hypothetical protein
MVYCFHSKPLLRCYKSKKDGETGEERADGEMRCFPDKAQLLNKHKKT